MNYGEGGLSASDVALLQGRNSGSDGFGDGNGWWIIIFLIFALGGWGNRGFGGFGGNTGTEGAMNNYVLNSDFATLSRQIDSGFASQERKLDGITNGLCDGFYTQAQLINGVNTNILTSSNAIQSQLANCCCEIREGISGINFNLAKGVCDITTNATMNTRDIIENQNANYRALHDEIVANRIEDKNAQIQAQQNEINALRLAASQEKQNAFITQGFANEVDALYNRLSNCPVPTTPVYGRTPIFTCGCGNNYNNNCGCNCNGNF